MTNPIGVSSCLLKYILPKLSFAGGWVVFLLLWHCSANNRSWSASPFSFLSVTVIITPPNSFRLREVERLESLRSPVWSVLISPSGVRS